MIRICEYYSLNTVRIEENKCSFSDSTGATLNFICSDWNASQSVSHIIEINTSQSSKRIEEILKQCGFRKNSNFYVKGQEGSPVVIKATLSGNKRKILSLQKVKVN